MSVVEASISDGSDHLKDLSVEEQRKALKDSVALQYPQLDWLMIDSCVDLFLKFPDATPEDFIAMAPKDYFIREDQEKQGEEKNKVKVVGGPVGRDNLLDHKDITVEDDVQDGSGAGPSAVRGGTAEAPAAIQPALDHSQPARADGA